MQLANEEAHRFDHEYIGPEHLLLGLIEEGSGVAANVLKNLHVDLGKLRLDVERLMRKGEFTAPQGTLPQSPATKKVIDYATEEARALRHNYLGSEHLLLGLLHGPEGIAAEVLRNCGLTLENVRAQILSLLGWGIPDFPTAKVGGRIEEPREDTAASDPSRAGESLLTTKRLNDHARSVIQLAEKAASRFNHEYLGTEHFLLGLVQEGSWVVEEVLRHLHVDSRRIHRNVNDLFHRGPDRIATGSRPSTPKARNVLEYATEEAGRMHHNYVGAEHILLGLLREEECVAAQILNGCGVRLEGAREEILSLIGPWPPDHPVAESGKATGESKGTADKMPTVCPHCGRRLRTWNWSPLEMLCKLLRKG